MVERLTLDQLIVVRVHVSQPGRKTRPPNFTAQSRKSGIVHVIFV